MTADFRSKITSWLEKEGYPLEMRVAHTFREAGFEVSSSEYYIDPQEQKAREIDVIASMSIPIQGVVFQIAFVIECKSSKESPWVCFSSGNNPARDATVGLLARVATREGRDLLTEISANTDVTTTLLFELPTSHAYGVVNALKDGADLPYRALLGARSAAQALVSHYDKLQTPPSRIETVCIAFPLVVVGTPLFTCTLGPKGELELNAATYQTILRTGFDTYYAMVEIVADSALADFVARKADLVAKFLRELPSRIPGTLQALDVANLASDDD